MKDQTVIIRDDATRRRVAAIIASLPLNLPWSITWGPHKKRRSLSQNALYWKLVGVLASETGHTPDEIHEVIKQRFLTPRVVEVNGQAFEVRSTAKLTTSEFSDLTSRVYAMGAEMGIYLPAPEEMGMR